MPILRLVLIYVALILAVMAVFNREKLGRLVFGEPAPERAVAAAPAPVHTPVAPAAPAATTPAPMQPATPAPVQPVAPAPAQMPTPQAPSAPAAPQFPPPSFEPGQPMPTAPQPGALQTPTAAPTPTPRAAPAPGLPARPEPSTTPMDMAPEIATALNNARSAYWGGDADTAEAMVADLIAADPSNPDLHGELGNLRYARRDYQGAADAFVQAAEILIAQGRRSQAAALVPVVSQIDPDRALALATRLQNR